ncbi:hypothetical protein Msi02_77920 [Microbispora siamensis]|uniref:Uncharacterized protein n=1 Tax=Microbispora siamensis TaxID=564413 RepID=A0ABQ4GZW3_9ACTN|nr:hypothetical protein Msi02_77920 [Microbispora siamensis]
MRLGHLLYGLQCVACGSEDRLWADYEWNLIECRECGERTPLTPEISEFREAE